MFYQTGNYLLLFCVLFNAMHSSSALYSASGLRGVKMKWNVQNCWVKTTDDTRTTVAKQKTPCQYQWIHIFLNSWDRLSVSCTPGSNRIPYEQCDMSHTALLKYICSAYLSEWTSVAVPNIHSMCTQHLHPCAVCEMWCVTATSKKKQQHSFYSSRTLSIVIAVIINTMSDRQQIVSSHWKLQSFNIRKWKEDKKKKKRTSEASDVEVKRNL